MSFAFTRLCFALLCLVASDLSAEEGDGLDEPPWRPPPFFDYDCDLVNTRPQGAVTDWNAAFDMLWANVKEANRSDYSVPDELRHLLEGETAQQAEEECPLGVMYLKTLEFYEGMLYDEDKASLLDKANYLQGLIRRFPVAHIALSRWPVFFALEHFAPMHGQHSDSFCDGVVGVLDWGDLRAKALVWASMKKRGSRFEEETVSEDIGQMFFTILRNTTNQNRAQDECKYGFLFLVASQVVAAANRETHHMPPFNAIIDMFLAEVPFPRLAACGWPVFTVLAIFADLNKGLWFFSGGDRKYLRGYSDWNLRRDELSPLVPSSLDFLSHDWRTAVASEVDRMLPLPADEFREAVEVRAAARGEVDGPMRPIVRRLLDAALEVAAACGAEGAGGRRLAYVVLVYGAKWSEILARLAGRMWQLRMTQPLLVIAIGSEAADACAALAAQWRERGAEFSRPVCWTPDSQSQVHRFTAIHALLHLGIDIIYVDMDTFMVQDPTPRILEQADGYDALFARHGDADCINIGVFYLRASAHVALWFSQFVTWYHDHPFEIDQRGLHVFLRLPSKQLRVAYLPSDLAEVRGGVLEDVNEVVIGDIGWHGDLFRLLIFHWCHRPIAQKEQEINSAYDAADAVEAHGLPLAVAIQSLRRARVGSPWEKVLDFRIILETYRKAEPMQRTYCW